MLTVYEVSRHDFQATRLHLPSTAWSDRLRSNLLRAGFALVPQEDRSDPDLRGPEEIARKDHLLDEYGPSY